MARYISRRLLHAILLLLAVSFFSFLLLQLAPGDFFDAMRLNPQISQHTVEGIRSEYGLDRPLPIRYERWLRAMLKGNLGYSVASNSAVAPLLRVRARNTLLLSGTATLLAWLLALPIGVWSAAKRGSWVDRIGSVATSTILTVPDLLLFLGLLLLAARTGWFPTGGMFSPGVDDLGFWAKAKDAAFHLALPALGLAVVMMPVLVRHVRSATIEALESPFIRAARGHGIPRGRLLFRYALPAASNPLISLLGFSVATMLSTSMLAEVVLSWPGLGPLLVESIFSRDVYVVVAIVMLSSVFLVMGNLLADLLLFASDPRIRTE
ncbi:MAG TPA: ABC transporter permease [Candidatus Baltobacteraceae bacterium]|jgi:peptide/nickel transport system permease protein|nr:ABC transporter permease [Candidatus Baltobacteraceae bacterium]